MVRRCEARVGERGDVDDRRTGLAGCARGVVEVRQGDGVADLGQRHLQVASSVADDLSTVEVVRVALDHEDQVRLTTRVVLVDDGHRAGDRLLVGRRRRRVVVVAVGDLGTELRQGVRLIGSDDDTGTVRVGCVQERQTLRRLRTSAGRAARHQRSHPDQLAVDLVQSEVHRLQAALVDPGRLDRVRRRRLDGEPHRSGVQPDVVRPGVHQRDVRNRRVGVERGHQRLPGRTLVGVDQGDVAVDLVATAAALGAPRHDAPLPPPVQHHLGHVGRVDAVHPRRDLVQRVALDLAGLRVDRDEGSRHRLLHTHRRGVERGGVVEPPVVVDLGSEIAEVHAAVPVVEQPSHRVRARRARRVVQCEVHRLAGCLVGVGEARLRGRVRVLGVDHDVTRDHLGVVISRDLQVTDVVHVAVHRLQDAGAEVELGAHLVTGIRDDLPHGLVGLEQGILVRDRDHVVVAGRRVVLRVELLGQRRKRRHVELVTVDVRGVPERHVVHDQRDEQTQETQDAHDRSQAESLGDAVGDAEADQHDDQVQCDRDHPVDAVEDRGPLVQEPPVEQQSGQEHEDRGPDGRGVLHALVLALGRDDVEDAAAQSCEQTEQCCESQHLGSLLLLFLVLRKADTRKSCACCADGPLVAVRVDVHDVVRHQLEYEGLSHLDGVEQNRTRADLERDVVARHGQSTDLRRQLFSPLRRNEGYRPVLRRRDTAVLVDQQNRRELRVWRRAVG